MTSASTWHIGELKLRYDLVWSLAVSSLRVRLVRTLVTVLTITTATAFMMYLLSVPPSPAQLARIAAGEPQSRSWILMLVLALVVSGAGVLNTMLMSVSQRLREIGTIKCLGALDSLVLLSVLVEAALLGLLGAVVGVVVGLLIAILLGAVDHGGGVFGVMSWGIIPVQVLFVFGVGMALTTMGAAVPAWIASKLPPIEAMRGEK